jgi:hypothetical protein
VKVLVDADESLRAEIEYVEVEVRSGGGSTADWESRLSRRLTPNTTGNAWPIEILLTRQRDSDRGYLVTASARGAGDRLIAQVQARSEYVTGRTLALELRFDVACADRAAKCASTQSCRNGECVDSFVAPAQLPQFEDGGMAGSASPAASAGSGPAAQSVPSDCAQGSVCTCGRDNGGCDSLVACTMLAGKPVCAACPVGYVGDGASGCIPTLLSLTPERGKLTPAFSPEQTAYEVTLPMLADKLSLQLTAADGTTVQIDGETVASDASWTTPAPAFGADRMLVINVAAARHMARSISLRVRRASDATHFIKASNPSTGDEFSRTMAIWGDTLVVGAQFEDGGTRANASAPDDTLKDAGAVYVFVRDAMGTWRQQAYLKSDMPQQEAQFGSGVAIERDRLVIAARTEAAVGAAHVFERQNGAWTHTAVLRPDDGATSPEFGCSVTVHDDRIAVGACGHDGTNSDSGAVYVFDRGATDWTRSALLKTKHSGSFDWFGSTVQFAGNLLVAAATGEVSGSSISGVVHVYVAADGGTWNELNSLAPANMASGSFFGAGLAVSGDTIAVGAFNGNIGLTGGTVYIYDRGNDGNFVQSAVLQSSNSARSDYFGIQLALSGDQLVVGASGEVNTAGDGGKSLELSGEATT